MTHLPVLLREFVTAAAVRPGDKWIDGTFGRGGHSRALLQQGAYVLGLDQDPSSAIAAEAVKREWPEHFWWKQENFRNVKRCSEHFGWRAVQGILLDLGVSSPQLDEPQRGFSFRNDGPLDMRMNPQQATTAANLVNNSPDRELVQLFREHGDERDAKQIVRAIVGRRRERPFTTTLDLAEVVAHALPHRRATGVHPATKVFQALRIAVNEEHLALQEVLPQAVQLLAPSGKLAVISFHSGEDRYVKDFMRQHSDEYLDTPAHPNTLPNPDRMLNRPKRCLPSDEEMERNPRSRSARLRVASKLENRIKSESN